jgi:hypothetical protein
MTRTLRLALVIALGIGLLHGADPAVAQDLEIFQDDDFVDPALLKINDSERIFIATRAYAGVDTDYARRNDVYDIGVKFARVVNNIYFHRFQSHVSYTRFAVSSDDVRATYLEGRAAPFGVNTKGLPLARLGVETSRYLGGEGLYGRVKFMWNREMLMSGHETNEYGVTLDAKVFGELGLEDVDKGIALILGVQGISRPSLEQNYIGTSMRLTYDFEHASMTSALGYGFERTSGDWRSGAGRFQLGLIIPVAPYSTKIHATYSYVSLQSERLTINQFKHRNNELAVFISLPLFSHLF